MHFSSIAAASLAAVPFVAAHGGIPGAPRIFGLGPNPIAQLKNRNAFHGHAVRDTVPQQNSGLKARQGGLNGRCGADFGGASCDTGYCCSPSGWCGVGTAYCASPDCLFQYGPACDANVIPGGTDTSTIARPQIGTVDYGGEGVYACTVPGTIAITYDDGPYIYTAGVLDQFAAYNAKATFFITGNNNGKGPIDEASGQWHAVIQRMITEGHQVASHTWSHQDLSAITSQQRKDQMVRNEMAIRNIIGKFPTYMRPPYSSCTAASGCEADLAALGYVVTYFDLDTDDYNNLTPELIQNAKNRYSAAVSPSDKDTDDFLAIAHDIHPQTAQNLTGYMLDLAQSKGYRMVTVGECLGQPESAWYRDSAGSLGTYTTAGPTASATTSVPPIATPTAVSTDGSCGGTSGFTCAGSVFGNCCSQYGYCGSTTDHCDTGCQSFFGVCGGDSLPSTTTTSTAPTSTPTGPPSTDGSCGGTAGTICLGTSFGSCCSQYGYCGSTTDHCGTGCQLAFGLCGTLPSSTVSSTPPTSTPTGPVSTDGSCGGTAGSICSGSIFGNCCSEYGYCGSTDIYCGTGCQSAFGTCGNSLSSSSLSATSSETVASSSTSSTATSSETQSTTSSISSSTVVSSSTTDTSSSVVTTSSSSTSTISSSSVVTSSSSISTRTSSSLSTSSSSTVRSTSSSTTRSTSSSTVRSTSTSSTRTTSSTRSSTITTSTRPVTTTTRTSSTPTPTPTVSVSKDGKCGANNKKQTCKGSKYGNCCRFDGKCSSGLLACGIGCQNKYGDCWF